MTVNASAFQFLEEAIRHVPDEALARAVRALPDGALAEAVRQTPGLRGCIILLLVEQAGAKAKPNGKPTPQRRAAKTKTPRRPPRALDRHERVLALVRAAGQEGATTTALAGELDVHGSTVRPILRQLVEAGSIRKEGSTSSARYFAA